MNKKIFAISDLHGHYEETLTALFEAGWKEEDSSNLLVVVGDVFDRGNSSLALYVWLSRLTKEGKAVVLRGNHEPFFIEWLSGPVSNFNWRYNGLSETIDDFDGRTSSFFSWVTLDKGINNTVGLDYSQWDELWYEWSSVVRNKINTDYPDLLRWLNDLPNYFETEKHIFTHGSIQSYGDWKHPIKGWDWQHWDKGDFFGENIINTEKTVVVGHFHTAEIRKKYHLGNEESYDILHREDGRIIMLDGCTSLTKKVNVLVVEDNLLTE